ncbi:MAG: UvrD-helicase domain-containing protein [Anaerolineae bacterium]|nr:UvrD-helicase domain-containing protein [Anaerolineae bacterium]
MSSDLLAGLNPAQREAVTTVKGPVLVLAGPGSGKTRVLAHRVAYLLRVAGAHPRSVMAVTFTNKAAGEMRERINKLLGEAVPVSSGWKGLTIGTFHSICARILRAEAGPAGLNPNYVIYDDGEQLSAIRSALKDLKIDEKMYRPEAMRAAISKAKNELVKPENFATTTYYEEIARRVYARYEQILKANGALDFDDLLCRVTWLFKEQPDVLARYQDRYEYLLVDEFQDTNSAQYEMVCMLAGRTRNLFAVGDEDQSIYGFRGADYRNVLRFREDFPDARVILLEQNYRSTQLILDAANAVIARNIKRTPKHLRTDRGAGAQVILHEAYDETDEAQFVVNTIQRLVGSGEIRLSDVAIMYRTNAQSRSLEDAFVARGVPYRLIGGTRFYQRKEIKDALAYLRLVHNPADNVSLMRVINVPPRAIGDKTISALAAWSGEQGVSMTGGLALVAGDLASPVLEGYRAEGGKPGKPPQHPFGTAANKALVAFYRLLKGWLDVKDGLTVSQLLEKITEQAGYATWLRDGTEEGEDRWENLQELSSVAAHYDDFPPELRLTAFLEEVALVSDQDELAEQDERVTLLTVHTAKGLEFPVVFLVGLEENVFPHSRSMEDPDQMEEERRLMYVGVTRAKDRLYLVRAFRRMLWGRSEINEPSRFLRDVAAAQGGTMGMSPVRGAPSRTAGMMDGARSGGWGYEPRDRRRAADDEDSWGGASRRSRPDEKSSLYGGTGGSRSWMPKPAPPQPPKKAERPAREPQFKPGDRVDHGLFGQGIVLKSEVTADDEEVTVAFQGKGTKTLLAGFAKLRKAPR